MPRSRSIDCIPGGCLHVLRMCVPILLSSIFTSFLGRRKGWNTLGTGSDRLWAGVVGVWKEGCGASPGQPPRRWHAAHPRHAAHPWHAHELPWQPPGSRRDPAVQNPLCHLWLFKAHLSPKITTTTPC